MSRYQIFHPYPLHPPPHHLGRPPTLYPTMKYWNWCILRPGLPFLVYSTLIISIQAVPYTPLSFAHLNANTRSCASSANSSSDSPFSTQASNPLPEAEALKTNGTVSHPSLASLQASTFNLHYPRYTLHHILSNRWLYKKQPSFSSNVVFTQLAMEHPHIFLGASLFFFSSCFQEMYPHVIFFLFVRWTH